MLNVNLGFKMCAACQAGGDDDCHDDDDDDDDLVF